jgi:serine protease AprX
MFRISNKLDNNIKWLIKQDYYEKYRILICCNSLLDKTSDRVQLLKGEIIYKLTYSNIICAKLNKNSILRLIEYPSVSYIMLDESAALPSYSKNKGSSISINMDSDLTGKGVTIGIIDSGVYPHKDLSFPKNKIAGFLDIVNNHKFPYDDSGHGTLISGLISSSGHSSKENLRGIAPDADIFMIKAFSSSNKSFISSILYSLEFLINISEQYCIKIILMPFCINNSYIVSAFNSLFNMACHMGITIIVSAGDSGSYKDSISGFSLLNNCITVGSFDSLNKDIYKDSSGGNNKIKKPDFIAPCSGLLSLNCDLRYIPERNGKKIYPETLKESYSSFSGISISSAYAAALAALLFEKSRSLQIDDIKSLLKASCNIVNLPKYLQGEGIINKLLS